MMVVGKEDLGLSLSLACSNNPKSTSNITTTNTSIHNHIHNHNNITSVSSSSSSNNNASNFGFFMNRNQLLHHHQQLIHQTPPPNASPLQLNLMITPSSASAAAASTANATAVSPSPAQPQFGFLQKLPWSHSHNHNHNADSDRNSESCRSFLRGIDVNRPAAGADEEDAGGVSSPNSTVSTVSGKRSSAERDQSAGAGEDVDGERASSRGLSDDEDGGENSRKKLRLTKDQSAILEESFKEHNTLNPKQKLALAKRLGLRPRQVEVWFQNRRARTKLKQTEVDCEFLKRCCEQLTEENRRLQKEVQELRALKMSPQFYMQMTPPTTLTMCPSCERVAVPPSAAATSAAHTGSESRPAPTHRPMPVNPWAVSAPVPIRPFEALHPRS